MKNSLTLREALSTAKRRLLEQGISDGAVDAWFLMEQVMGCSRADFLLKTEEEMPEDALESYMELVRLRETHIPLQHILGTQEFMGLSFLVNSHVLIPRQETELLVEKAGMVSRGKAVLDLCTGSGCIIISLERLYGIEKGVGVDLSKDALLVAGKNAKNLGAETYFLESDLFEQVKGKFDVIVSNPPYIRTADIENLMREVKEHEPKMALDGGEDGLYFYRRIIMEAGKFLKKDGYILFEIGHDQREDVCHLLEEGGFAGISAFKDYAGLDRVVSARYSY